MKKNDFGVFELTIPPTADGKPAIPHNSKIKVRMEEEGRGLTRF
jgi:1,4-alpha-glucan branching enzyme